MENMERIYTVEEVAAYLQISKGTLYGIIKSGSMKAIKVGKNYRVTESALKEYMTPGEAKQQKD